MKILRYLVIALALGFMGMMTAEIWPQIQNLDFRLRAGPTLLSLLLLILLFLFDAYGWLLILSSLNHSPPKLDNIRVWLLSSVARYLPGGIWSYVSRAEMTYKQGVDMASIGVALYLETILLAASSLVAGLPALAMAGGYELRWWYMLPVTMLSMAGFHPAFLGLARRLPGRIGASFAKVTLPDFSRMAWLYLYYLAFWCLFGLVFALFVDMLHPLSGKDWLPVGSSIALGFFAGFVMLFVPGGIGVRESALFLLLEPWISAPDALLVSLGSRLWIMAGEGLSLVLAEALFQLRKHLSPIRRT